MKLVTSRLLLAPLEVRHSQEWYDVSNDNGLTQFQISNYKMNSIEEARKWIQEKTEYLKRNGIGTIGVFHQHDSKLIGLCALKYLGEEKKSDIEIMFRLSEKVWGQGYGTEIAHSLVRYAESTLHLKTVVATVDLKNERSKAVLKKMGFAFEKMLHIQGLEEELHRLKFEN